MAQKNFKLGIKENSFEGINWFTQARKFLLFIAIGFFMPSLFSYAQTGTASWYSEESCRKEGTSGICANGEVFDDEVLSAASWDYPFNSVVEVRNLANGKTTQVRINDRGPARNLYKQGRVIDLSKKSFNQIAPLEQGIIQVEITRIK